MEGLALRGDGEGVFALPQDTEETYLKRYRAEQADRAAFWASMSPEAVARLPQPSPQTARAIARSALIDPAWVEDTMRVIFSFAGEQVDDVSAAQTVYGTVFSKARNARSEVTGAVVSYCLGDTIPLPGLYHAAAPRRISLAARREAAGVLGALRSLQSYDRKREIVPILLRLEPEDIGMLSACVDAARSLYRGVDRFFEGQHGFRAELLAERLFHRPR